jgi:hypothetical protein
MVDWISSRVLVQHGKEEEEKEFDDEEREFLPSW